MADNIDTRVTPALHPEVVKALEGYDSDTAPYLAPTETAFSEAYIGISQVFTAREKAATNPTWNEAQQIIQTQDLADKVFARVAKGFDATRANLDRSIAFLEGELSTPLAQKAVGSLGREIREHVKALTTTEKHKFLQEAIDAGDEETVSAVIGAKHYLTGISVEMQTVLTRAWHTRQQPEKAKRLAAMQGARSLIEKNAPLVFAQLEKAVGMRPDKVKALRTAKNDAEQAFVLKGAVSA